MKFKIPPGLKIFLILSGIMTILMTIWVIWVGPATEKFAQKQILDFIRGNPYADVEFSRIHLRVFSGAVSIDNIKIKTLDPELKEIVSDLEVNLAQIHIDLLGLFLGKIGVRKITLDTPQGTINLTPLLKDDGKPPQKIPTAQLFQLLNKIPIDAVLIESGRLRLTEDTRKMNVHLHHIDLSLYRRFNQLQAKIDAKNIRYDSNLFQLQDIRVISDFVLNPKEIEIRRVTLESPALELLGGGKFFDFENLLIFPKASLDVSVKSEFDQIKKILKSSPLQKQISDLSGKLQFKGQLTLLDLKKIQGKFETRYEDVSWQKFEFGDGKILGRFQNDKLSISDIDLNHPSGPLTLSKTEIQFVDQMEFQSQVRTKGLDLMALFHSLNLREIPVWMEAELDAPCKGTLRPLKVRCEVSSKFKDLDIRPSTKGNAKPIVQVAAGSVRGQVEVTQQKLTYDGLLEVNKSKAASQGVIDFKKGFQIKYESDFVDLSDVSPISGLHLKGQGRLSGTTDGNAHTAKMSMSLQVEGFEFERYKFGNLDGTIELRSGQLIFDRLKGLQGASPYSGYLLVDLREDTLRGKFDFPNARIQDLTEIHKAQLEIPFEITGQGSAQVEFNGPLDFWQLNTEIQAQFKNLNIAGETFDSFRTEIRGENGTMNFRTAQFRKSRGLIDLRGAIRSDKTYSLNFGSTGLVLEESSILAKLNSNIYGAVDFTGDVTGAYNDPLLRIKSKWTKTVLEEQELASSEIDLQLTKNYFLSDFRIFDSRMNGKIQIPLGESSSPYIIKAQMNKWRFGDLYSLTGGSNLAADYTSEITGDIDLYSEPGKLETTRGSILVKQLLFGRGSGVLRNKEPLDVQINQGNVDIKPFALTSSNQNLTLPRQNFSLRQMSLLLLGQLDVHLFHIFVPTLEEMTGIIDLNLRVEGTWVAPELFGTLSTQAATVRIRGLPHPIERIQALARFTRSRLNIEKAHAVFAGGQTTATGFIQFEGIGRAPMNIKMDIKGMNLNVPDKVRTSGDANLMITGEEFPFLLSGNYRVLSGLIERDFLASSEKIEVKQSIYLPQNLKKEIVSPLEFDVQIVIDNPLQIRNPQAEGSLTGALRLKGTPTNPLLFGKIQLDRETLITFKDKFFNLQNGVIEFNNPSKISPDLFISAQTRVAEYDINLMLLGSSDDPDLRLTSVPPLPFPDLLSLLALGVTPTAAENTQSTEQARRTGFELGAVILSNNPINRQLQDRLGVNIQLTTTLDSTKNVNVPKVIASRRLTKKVNASASRSLGGDETVTEMKIQYMINKNVSAIGSYENRENNGATNLDATEQRQKSIFGVDLEYRRDFK